MRKITVQVTQLQSTLKKNRDAHREAFLEAMKRYREKAIEVFEENIEEVKQGGPVRQMLGLPAPSDHTRDYDRALEMLKWHQEDEIELDEREFQTYVQDDWGWKQDFTSTNQIYGVSS